MDQPITRILCCVGLRGDCDVVLERAVSLALACGAELQVLHAVKSLDDDVMNTLRVNIRSQEVLDKLMRQRLAQAREQLDYRMDAFWSTHPEARRALGDKLARQEVVEGYPATLITRLAAQRGCDLIVMAANKRGFAASYAGKVTRGVIKRATVPVVVVPPPA
ncbi:universal stress protein [Halomonas ramblicola]|uniref:universal stress protein n=1 Tax=Halomonas ramblicola TaxID=747349 RepID=UPI0025B58620|nr:universal stress protein [Halomonas ramblicola]MDN3521601.1 universal stress protein [Halomonas ramblicola]